MPSLIYVHAGGQYDHSRWLTFEPRGDDQVVLQLQDLCHPGRLSQLKSVTCPREFLDVALERGTLQITTSAGYLLIKTVGDYIQLEFRGLDDLGTNKVSVLRSDFSTRLQSSLPRTVAH